MAALAHRQHGNVARWQLLSLSFDDNAIRHRVTTGRLFRVHLGVYAVGRPPKTPLERAGAALLACGEGAALSHRTGGTLWGWWKEWETPLHTIVVGDRRPQGIRTHRVTGLQARDLTVQLGLRVTSPARTLLDCAPLVTPAHLTRAVNDARLARHLRMPALADVVERFSLHPGARLLAPFLDNLAATDGPTRSQFEDEFVAFCARHRLPRPRLAAAVAGHEVDAMFEAERLIVELDSWEHHHGRTAFETDRARDADTLAAGFATVRVTWERMHVTPDEEAERLRAILRTRRVAGSRRVSRR